MKNLIDIPDWRIEELAIENAMQNAYRDIVFIHQITNDSQIINEKIEAYEKSIYSPSHKGEIR